ncbi:metalloregulator ArsR/SmtB family transcription factor [Micromonospora sonneratiae]|uniref:ArsR/SmtB family transcription factor n=1 Tax=Micromonospora sonneratiae TaxID=1184706 RepID=A0ABW3YL43_9ACTN
MDAIFKALADPSRRQLLDRLNQRNGQSLQELCTGLDMTRQSVTKHLAVLEAANLITVTWRGREKIHYLNAAPISDIAERWISRYHRGRAEALADLKRALEEPTVSQTEFVYATYIRTTPEQLWKALTEPAFTFRYWGAGLQSDWQVGSPILWQPAPGEDFQDLDQVVLEAQPFRRLSYTWHNYQPDHAEIFGWTDEALAELMKEKRSKVTFDIEPAGSAVKLTVTHDGFETDSEMLKAVSGRKPETGGWPELLANLKTLLETGDTLHPVGS